MKITRKQFIEAHILTCNAGIRAKKYDAKQSANACHSMEYTRRKCAKKIWKKMVGTGTQYEGPTRA